MSSGSISIDAPHVELYEIIQRDCAFEQKAQAALELGERYLGVDNAHLTRIDPDTDFWQAIVSTDPPDGDFPPGLTLDMQSTYCRRTVTRESSIALHDAPAQGWEDDPAFEAHGLHCYHGTPITLGGISMGRSVSSRNLPETNPSTRATHCSQNSSLVSSNTNSNTNAPKKRSRSGPTRSPCSVGCYATTSETRWVSSVVGSGCFLTASPKTPARILTSSS